MSDETEVLDPEVVETVEEVVVPDDADVSHTKAFKGIVTDLQSERQARRDLQGQINELQEKMADAGSGELIEGDDDDLMTKAQVKKMVATLDKQRQVSIDKEQKAKQNSRFLESEEQTRQDFTAKKQGEGLDFDTVISLGMSNLRKGDRINIQESTAPAREAYELCILRTPALKKRVEAVKNAKVVSDLKEKGSSPKGRREDTGNVEFNNLVNMPESELMKLIEEQEG